jgi:hypothetical protein
MALADIRTDIQANWPDSYHSSDLTDDKTDEFINLAQRWVCRQHNFTFMEMEVTRSTVDSQRQYSVPIAGDTDWTDVNSGTVRRFKTEIENGCELVDASDYRKPLTKLFKSQVKERKEFKNTADAGTPSVYCIEQEYIELWKLPDHSANSDTAWTIYFAFYGYLADLASGNTSNAITTQYPEVLEYYATALGYRFGEDPDMESYWLGKAAQVLAEMIAEDTQRKLSTIEEGMRPGIGQSLGGDDDDSLIDVKAHYE